MQTSVTDEDYLLLRASTRAYAEHRFLNASYVPGTFDLGLAVLDKRKQREAAAATASQK